MLLLIVGFSNSRVFLLAHLPHNAATIVFVGKTDFQPDVFFYAFQTKEAKRKETCKDADVIPRQPRSTTGGSYTSVQSPLAEAFQWTFIRREGLEKLFPHVHPQLQPDTSQWVEVELVEMHSTFHLHKQSPAFAVENEFLNLIRTGKRNSKNVITHKVNGNCNEGCKFGRSEIDENVKYQKLNLFESCQTTNDFSCTFYVGGPIWGTAWCPRSDSRDLESQFLAVCCHFGEHSLEPQNLCHESVLLQIWNCGRLPVRPHADFQLVQISSVLFVIFLNSSKLLKFT